MTHNEIRISAFGPIGDAPALTFQGGVVRDMQEICGAAQCSTPGVTRPRNPYVDVSEELARSLGIKPGRYVGDRTAAIGPLPDDLSQIPLLPVGYRPNWPGTVAQTPTDDEREALEAKAWGEQYMPGMSQKEAAAFKRGHAAGWRDAGFRRSEVPEPGGRRAICAACGVPFHLIQHDEGCDVREGPGEPSDAQLLAQGFRDGVDYIDDQPGPWGAAVVAGRAEAARRVAAAGGADQRLPYAERHDDTQRRVRRSDDQREHDDSRRREG